MDKTKELRLRLKKLHQEIEAYISSNDGPISFDIEELKDIAEFMDMFLYD